jgi:hypothetical protein
MASLFLPLLLLLASVCLLLLQAAAARLELLPAGAAAVRSEQAAQHGWPGGLVGQCSGQNEWPTPGHFWICHRWVLRCTLLHSIAVWNMC